MTISPHAAVAHGAPSHPLNPAQQTRAADPTAKGAAFGALVSQCAKAKHASASEPPIDTAVAPTTTTTATTTDTSTTSIVV
jgi:hypothetical protein